MGNTSKNKELKPLWFHIKHKWKAWEVMKVSGHVYQIRSCAKCNYTVKRVKVEQTR